MAKSKRLSTLMTTEGVEYVFNTKELKRLYDGTEYGKL